MNRFLDLLQRASDWWFGIGHWIWKRLTIAFIVIFASLVLSTVAFGVSAAIWWREALWADAILIVVSLAAMQLAGLFGMMSCITDKEEEE